MLFFAFYYRAFHLVCYFCTDFRLCVYAYVQKIKIYVQNYQLLKKKMLDTKYVNSYDITEMIFIIICSIMLNDCSNQLAITHFVAL